MSEAKFTPGPWSVWTSNSYRRIGSDSTGVEVCYGAVQRDGHPDLGFSNGGFTGPDARLIAAAPELLEALQEYVLAEEMTTYGDASDFVWPKIEMCKPGETAWGWICEKHGLGYQGGCICCHDEYLAHKERKDSSARYARDDALRDARKKARAAIAKATGA